MFTVNGLQESSSSFFHYWCVDNVFSRGGGGERGTAGLGVNCAEGTRAEVGVGERDAGWGGEIGGGSVTKLKCK